MSAYVRPGSGRTDLRWHHVRWSAPGIYQATCNTLGWPAEVQAHYGTEWTYTIKGQPVELGYDPDGPICRRCVNRIASEADAVARLAARNQPPASCGGEQHG